MAIQKAAEGEVADTGKAMLGSMLGTEGGAVGILNQVFGHPGQARTTVQDVYGKPRTVLLPNALPRTGRLAQDYANVASIYRKYSPDWAKYKHALGSRMLQPFGIDPNSALGKILATAAGDFASQYQGTGPVDQTRHLDALMRAKMAGASDEELHENARLFANQTRAVHGLTPTDEPMAETMSETDPDEAPGLRLK